MCIRDSSYTECSFIKIPQVKHTYALSLIHIYLHRKAGDKVKTGDVICSVYGNNVKKVEKALEEAGNAVKIGEVKKEAGTLIKKIIR